MGTAASLVREFNAAFNARQLNRLAEIMTPDIEMISPRGAARGYREVCALLEAGFEMFPDLAVEPIHLVEDGASAAAQQRFTAGQLAACELVMVDTRAGRINSWRTYYDQLPVLVAAGLAPPQPGGPVDHSRYPGADPAALGRRMIELIDTGRTAFDEVFPADAVFVHPSTPVTGSAQVAELHATVRAAFPDAKHTITRVVAADGFAALEGTWIGTHTATLRTTHGEVPATGLRVSTPFASLVRVAGTHIGAVHVHTDQVSFAAQLGLLPAPA